MPYHVIYILLLGPRPPQWGWVVARLWLFMTLRVLYIVTAHSACIGVRWPWLRTWCVVCILWHVCIVYIYIHTFLDMHFTCMHIVHICLYTHNSHTFLNEERSHTHIYIYSNIYIYIFSNMEYIYIVIYIYSNKYIYIYIDVCIYWCASITGWTFHMFIFLVFSIVAAATGPPLP